VPRHAGLTIHNGKQPGINYNTNGLSTANAVLSGFNSLGIIVSGRLPSLPCCLACARDPESVVHKAQQLQLMN
jgi:hypothetical protein